MQIINSLAEIILMSHVSPWWWLAVIVVLVLFGLCVLACLWFATKGAVDDPDDEREELEWMRSQMRKKQSQLRRDGE